MKHETSFAHARDIYTGIFSNHVSCFIFAQNPFVNAVFRVKHDVSSRFTKKNGVFYKNLYFIKSNTKTLYTRSE